MGLTLLVWFFLYSTIQLAILFLSVPCNNCIHLISVFRCTQEKQQDIGIKMSSHCICDSFQHFPPYVVKSAFHRLSSKLWVQMLSAWCKAVFVWAVVFTAFPSRQYLGPSNLSYIFLAIDSICIKSTWVKRYAHQSLGTSVQTAHQCPKYRLMNEK